MKAASSSALVCCVFALNLFARRTAADEGMWLFNDLPRELLQERYGFAPDDEWARHVMLSSVRFNSGGSASFISSQGLVITNHHVAADTLHKLSTPEHNYVEDGFTANSHDEEIKTPDLELNQLVSIEDVTQRVGAAVTPNMPAAEAAKARREVMAQIEKESLDRTGLRSDVITLFGGAKYHLYRYKKYTDVRLVWAPETKAAFFGGDADNFEYPRYCLDAALFRVYENGRPAQIDHFLKYSQSGPQESELVLVSGNPGRTQRIFTVAALKYLRDKRLPYVMDYLRRLEVLLQQFSYEGDEQKRRARDELFGIQNARKAYGGMLRGLQNPAFLDRKETDERELLGRIAAKQSLRKYLPAWEAIAEIQTEKAELLGQTASFANVSQYYAIAENLVLMAAEDQKPSGERLREFRDSARESLEQQLFSPAPIYADLELVKLADGIARFVERRGGDDELVKKVLAGKAPQERAAELIGKTSLQDVDTRRRLAQGGQSAIDAADDPLLELAQMLEPEFRRLRALNDELDERERQAYAQITEAKVALEGTSGYPDATFTLRLAFGTVKSYTEDGRQLPPWTEFAGAFAHEKAHNAEGDWQLPESWHEKKKQIDLSTPLNFVSTVDIIGGNSGSPVINRQGEFVGIIFDGNLPSLTADYFYSDEKARAISVHSSAIREALTKIYGAQHLADELGK